MPDPFDMDLTGMLLVAMPGMGDPRFDRSVIFVCAHSKDGAMGLIVNKPTREVTLGALAKQLEIKADQEHSGMRVHMGGPVERARGFVLHSSEYQSKLKTLNIGDAFGMTATLDVIEDMAAGQGPQDALIMLGYAGWGSGQLEGEIAQNGWLTVDASPELVFATEDTGKWAAALATLGIDPLSLSASAGRA